MRRWRLTETSGLRPRSVAAAAAPLLLTLIALAFARWNYFFQDDAYISLRYARNLARGHGLVWAPGSTEFGYTNFLFTALEGLLLKLGASGELAAALLSVPSSLAAVLLVFVITRELSGSLLAAFAAGLMVATHTSFSAYASGGLETSLQTMLVLLTYWLVWRLVQQPTLARAGLAGGSAALAMLCRLDSVLLLTPAILWPWWQSWGERPRASPGSRIHAGARVLVGALPVMATLLLLAWCRARYGQALPNTFYAKAVGQGSTLAFGTWYILSFILAQAGFVVALGLLALGSVVSRDPLTARREPIRWYLGAATIGWAAYLVYVGGDFMEFRMLVPVIPMYAIMACSILGALPAPRRQRSLVMIMVLALGANLYHRDLYPGFNVLIAGTNVLIESTRSLDRHVRESPSWIEAGRALHGLFYTGGADDVVIATTAAGAIPYFSDLPTIDELGLNDRFVAMHGAPHSPAPGHRRIATLHYLRERGVNLVIHRPGFDCRRRQEPDLHAGLPLVLIPLQRGPCALEARYLIAHPRIDSLVAEGRVKLQMAGLQGAPGG